MAGEAWAAFEAWHDRPAKDRKVDEEYWALRDAAWEEADFSWAGLADAGWELGDRAAEVQKMKRWRAPADFPIDAEVQGEGEDAWKPATLQDYWRPHRDWRGGAWGFDAEDKARLRAAGLAEEGWYDARGLATDEAMAAAFVRSGDGPAPRHHVLYRNRGSELAEAEIRAIRRLVARKLHTPGLEGQLHLSGAIVDAPVFAAMRAFGSHVPRDSSSRRPPISFLASFSMVEAADFSGLLFGQAKFEGASFAGKAQFEGASFAGDVRFKFASFSGHAVFRGARFDGDVDFVSATFGGDARFDTTYFSGNIAHFLLASFGGDAGFDHAEFARGYARFGGANFASAADFSYTKFAWAAGFVGTTFEGNTRFDSARFRSPVWFARTAGLQASFEMSASFAHTVFESVARFERVRFRGKVRFHAAIFRRFADFSGAEFPTAESDWRSAFDKALVQGTLDCRGAPFHCISAFDGATFERGVHYPKLPEQESDRAFHDAALAPALAASDSEAALAALEGGARTLVLAFEQARDRLRAQSFYRYELIARRKQKATPPWEKLFSLLYAWAADYGGSIARPLGVLLFVLLPAFGAIYYALAGLLAPAQVLVGEGEAAPYAPSFSPLALPLFLALPSAALAVDLAWTGWTRLRAETPGRWGGAARLLAVIAAIAAVAAGVALAPRLGLVPPARAFDDAMSALTFSWSNIFRPLTALATEPPAEGSTGGGPLAWQGALLFGTGAVAGLVVRVLATLQSVSALLLAFLSALAIRRRFQIG